MTEAERRALEVRCPTCKAEPKKACLHLTMERPKPWWPERKWLNRWRELELVRPHRRRTERFRDTVLYHEEDHRGRPFRLIVPSRLRRGQVLLVEKHQEGAGEILVPRKVKHVIERRDGRVSLLLTGPIPPTIHSYERDSLARVPALRPTTGAG